MKEKKLKFYEGTHTYWLGRQKLTSVTTFIGKFFPPFEAQKIAKRLSHFPFYKQKGMGVRKILAEWKESAYHGTRVHEALENFLLGNQTKVLKGLKDSKDTNKYNEGKYYLNRKLNSMDKPLDTPELRIHDEELGLAGTIDLFISEGEGEDKVITLIDWKTNKAIKKKSFDGKTFAYPPMEAMQDCNYEKYSLQLSLYAYMLERQGYTIKELIIVHLQEDKAVEIIVPYLKDDIIKMLEYKNGNR